MKHPITILISLLVLMGVVGDIDRRHVMAQTVAGVNPHLKGALMIVAMLLISLLMGGSALAGQIQLDWTAPQTNEDGSPLSDLQGYILYHGTASGQHPTAVPVGNVTSYTLSMAGGQTYFFVVTAQDTSGNESLASNEASATLPPDPPPPPPMSGLIAAYAFNEGTGTVVNDVTGNHPGTISGATWIGSGKYGKALRFDGANDWVTIPDHVAFDLTTGMTLMAWVYPTVTLSNWRTIIQKEAPWGASYYLHANSEINRPATGVYIGGEMQLKGGNRLTVNRWTHVAATYDGSRQRLYLNGVQVASRAQSGSIAASTGALRLGGNSIWGEYFKGRLDEIRLYNQALTSAEINTARQTPLP